MKNLLLLLLCAATFSTAAQTRYHVHAAATGTQTGLTWADAFTDLQAALTLAEAGDTVWVAEGVYLPTITTERTKSFEPRSGVRLIGGFSGTETIENQRDWNAHPTILSGDIGTLGDSTDNVYNVVYLELPDSNTVINGFTIRDGNANYSGIATARDRRRCGGGMYINGTDWEAYPNILNCRFVHNTARTSGGGIFINGDGNGSVAPQIVNCRFEWNRSVGSGGALARLGGSWVERKDDLKGCVFSNNNAGTYGGAFYYLDNERNDGLDITSDSFYRNDANLNGASVYGIVGRQSDSKIKILESLFQETHSSKDIIQITSNGYYVDTFLVHNCRFNKNEITGFNTVLLIAIIGKATSSLLIKGNVFSFNKKDRIVAFESIQGTIYIQNNLFDKNTCGVLMSCGQAENTIIEKCAAYNCFVSDIVFSPGNTKMEIINSILYNIRKSPAADSISLTGTSVPQLPIKINGLSAIKTKISNKESSFNPDTLFLLNCIFNGSPLPLSLLERHKYAYVSHCAFDAPDCSWFPNGAVCGPGNLFGLDPMFADTANGDFHLLPCSPLLDAGSNDFVTSSTDLNGDPRIQGGTVDIGALESPPFQLAAEPVVGPSCPGGASGSVAFDLQNACAPVSLYWAGPGNEQGNAISNLPAGAYSVTLTDARGRSVVAPLVVPVGAAPEISPITTPVACGDTLGGSATVSVSGATPPVAFSWQNSASTDSLRTDLPAGTYLLTITDALGCTATGTAEVGRTGGLDLDFEVQNVSCFGAADGSLSVLPANGKAPFEWQWGNGITAPFLAGLSPGQYPGTLTDALGCSIAWSLPVSEPAQLVLNGAVTPATDSSSADGSIVLDADGGTQPYSVLWSTEDDLWALYNLQTGAYTATLTDGNGCQLDSTFVVGVVSGTSDLDSKIQVVAWPNPVVNTLHFQAHNAALRQVVLHDAQGREVRRRSANDTYINLDVNDLPSGAYVWEIQFAQPQRAVATGKIVK